VSHEFHEMTGIDRVHFVGIGGAGMSGIAEILLDYDLEVSGSDQAESDNTRRLQDKGARVHIGHDPSLVAGMDLVVKSSAVADDNVEILAAKDRGIPVIRRAEMLAELMRVKYGIAVAGTHGKTTTTSLVGTVLTHAGLDPTVIVGGRLRVTGTGARYGRSRYLVVEADEYDRSFLRLSPVLAVVTNIEVDHLDTYENLDDIVQAFERFAGRVPFFGQVIACLDDRNVQGLLPRLADRRILTYGFSPQADLVAVDVRLEEGRTRFGVRRNGSLLGEVSLPLPGRHNVQNALATLGVATALGLELPQVAAGLETFKGVHRRFERLGVFRGSAVIDDYAHHPTEVAATLAAAREIAPAARIHAVFQPHLYSRTREHAEEFGRALLGADTAWVTPIYGSRERPIPGVSSELVTDAARRAGHRRVRQGEWDEVVAGLAATVEAGDVVLTLGAGDIYRLGVRLVGEEEP